MKYIFCIGLIALLALVNVFTNEEVTAGFYIGFMIGVATVLMVIW
jgi:phosphatidylserine synthase